jgi:hypothetical protein
MPTAQEEKKAALSILMAVAEAIKDLGSVPSGHLYATLMGHLSLDQYQQVIRVLKQAGLVKEENHLLTYTGPR